MKKLFSGYYRPNANELKTLWDSGIFVFDTNVLLNIYSYPEDVRNVFISVLKKINGRIWIPYQVGLEFHRNRFPRIKQANQRVEKLLQTILNTSEQLNSEVKSVELEKRNIGIDNIQDRLTAIKAAHTALSDAVQLACDKLPPISLDDSIGIEISTLFSNCVGSPPINQAALDELLVDAQDRYEKKIPPGFADENKGDDTHRDRGITYQRKYGDLILWRQLLAHASENHIKSIVFVTGDKKKDWWWLDDNKTLGPLPELVQEINMQANVELFWMYSADQFLQHAETYLEATEVTKEAVQQVKEISANEAGLLNIIKDIDYLKHMSFGKNLDNLMLSKFHNENLSNSLLTGEFDSTIFNANFEKLLFAKKENKNSLREIASIGAIEHWLNMVFPSSDTIMHNGFPSFLVNHGEYISGYKVEFIHKLEHSNLIYSISGSALRGNLEVKEGRLHDFSIILIIPSKEWETFANEDSVKEIMEYGNYILNKHSLESIYFGVVINNKYEVRLIVRGKK